jgi:peptidoglycan/LPS O-acetylase OafA/YrhL
MANRIPRSRIPELDGLRGMAILAVWLGHYFYVPSPGMFRILSSSWLSLGWSGVDLFFVLSGFLIGGILLDSRDSPGYYKSFYARRFFRIIPIYYAWIAGYILLVVIGGPLLRAHAHTGNVEGFDWPIVCQFLFLQNFGAFLSSPLSYFWFAATWSLAVEEQFYLISPVLVRVMSRRILTNFLLGVIAIAPFVRLYVRTFLDNGPWLAYRLMPCRADVLAIGVLAAILWRNPAFQQWLSANVTILYGLLAILFAGVTFLWRWYSDPLTLVTQTGGYTWLAFFYVVIVLLVLSRPAGPIARFARNGFLRDLGRVSYCLYIVHAAVFLICHQLLSGGLPSAPTARTRAISLLAAGISYVIAKISWKFIEHPILEHNHSHSPKAWRLPEKAF